MTRREFMIKNYGNDVVDDEVFGGIQGCPGHYKKLVDADKSITSGTAYGACLMKPGQLSDEVCTKCWDQEIPGTKKTRPHGFRLEKVEKKEELSPEEALERAVYECDSCKYESICKYSDAFRQYTREIYREEIAKVTDFNLSELGIRLRTPTCKRYQARIEQSEINRYIFEAQLTNLNQETIRRLFGEDKEEKK